jgi:thymidylate synthase
MARRVTSTIVGETAHDVISESIDFVLDEGRETTVWGGTIPDDWDDGPSDHEQQMLEYTDGFSMVLENPTANWCDISRHWPGITLRETEDDLRGLNPGLIPDYSHVYSNSGWHVDTMNFWREYSDCEEANPTPDSPHAEYPSEIYPHTYGRRMKNWGANIPGNEGHNQWEAVKEMLLAKPSTRKAVMSFWYPKVDQQLMFWGEDQSAYVPCNITFQLRVVEGDLNWHTFARSKDALRGTTENLFEFPLLQQLMTLELQDAGLNVRTGKYVEHIANMHLYQDHIDEGKHHEKEAVSDPYNEIDPFTPASLPPHEAMEEVDDELQKGQMTQSLTRALEIPSEFWRQWKLALIAEWGRLRDMELEHYHTCLENMEDAPWRIACAKRAYSDWEDDDLLRYVPESLESEVCSFE